MSILDDPAQGPSKELDIFADLSGTSGGNSSSSTNTVNMGGTMANNDDPFSLKAHEASQSQNGPAQGQTNSNVNDPFGDLLGGGSSNSSGIGNNSINLSPEKQSFDANLRKSAGGAFGAVNLSPSKQSSSKLADDPFALNNTSGGGQNLASLHSDAVFASAQGTTSGANGNGNSGLDDFFKQEGAGGGPGSPGKIQGTLV